MNLHYDDLYVAVTTNSEDKTLNQLVDTMADMQDIIENDMHAKIAKHKAMVIGSTYKLQQRVAAKMHGLGGTGLEVTASNLGIDYTAGRAVRTAKGRTKLHSRFARALPKMTRIRRLAKGSTATARQVFNQGLLPSVGFGTQLWGMPAALLAKLRSWYASSLVGPALGKTMPKSYCSWEIPPAPWQQHHSPPSSTYSGHPRWACLACQAYQS